MRKTRSLRPGKPRPGIGTAVVAEEVGEPLAAGGAGVAVSLKVIRDAGAGGIVIWFVLRTMKKDQGPSSVFLRVVEVGHGEILARIVTGASWVAAVA